MAKTLSPTINLTISGLTRSTLFLPKSPEISALISQKISVDQLLFINDHQIFNQSTAIFKAIA